MNQQGRINSTNTAAAGKGYSSQNNPVPMSLGEIKDAKAVLKQQQKLEEQQLKAQHEIEKKRFKAANDQLANKQKFEDEQLKIRHKQQTIAIDTKEQPKDHLKNAKEKTDQVIEKEVSGGMTVRDILLLPFKPPESH